MGNIPPKCGTKWTLDCFIISNQEVEPTKKKQKLKWWLVKVILHLVWICLGLKSRMECRTMRNFVLDFVGAHNSLIWECGMNELPPLDEYSEYSFICVIVQFATVWEEFFSPIFKMAFELCATKIWCISWNLKVCKWMDGWIDSKVAHVNNGHIIIIRLLFGV
jgi:hypothetical protein